MTYIVLNERLDTMLDWARKHRINLDNALLQPRHLAVTFYHANETHDNMLNVKRAVGKFSKSSFDANLVATVEYDHRSLKVYYEGAYICETKRDCKPAKFTDGADSLVE